MSAGFIGETEKRMSWLTRVTARIENTAHRIGAVRGTTPSRSVPRRWDPTAGPAWLADPDSVRVSQRRFDGDLALAGEAEPGPRTTWRMGSGNHEPNRIRYPRAVLPDPGHPRRLRAPPLHHGVPLLPAP